MMYWVGLAFHLDHVALGGSRFAGNLLDGCLRLSACFLILLYLLCISCSPFRFLRTSSGILQNQSSDLSSSVHLSCLCCAFWVSPSSCFFPANLYDSASFSGGLVDGLGGFSSFVSFCCFFSLLFVALLSRRLFLRLVHCADLWNFCGDVSCVCFLRLSFVGCFCFLPSVVDVVAFEVPSVFSIFLLSASSLWAWSLCWFVSF